MTEVISLGDIRIQAACPCKWRSAVYYLDERNGRERADHAAAQHTLEAHGWRVINMGFGEKPYFIRRILEDGTMQYYAGEKAGTSDKLARAIRYGLFTSARARQSELNGQS